MDWEPERADLDKRPTKRVFPYPDWHIFAACIGAPEQDFFGARDTTERPALSMSDVNRAKAICAVCPVTRSCISTALGAEGPNREEYGIWAGTSGRTRKRIWEMVEAGSVTMDEVIDDICAGQGAKYERKVILEPIPILSLKAVS